MNVLTFETYRDLLQNRSTIDISAETIHGDRVCLIKTDTLYIDVSCRIKVEVSIFLPICL